MPDELNASNEQILAVVGASAQQLDVIARVRDFVRRFVFFRSEDLYELVAAWVVSTYMTDLFEYVGYLFAYSPEPQSGKSRLLEVLDLLVNNSSGILVSPTEAVLFRTADGQTQLLDEVDAWRNKDELRSVLNAGFRFGGSVARMHEEGSDFNVRRFSVFGPRATVHKSDVFSAVVQNNSLLTRLSSILTKHLAVGLH